MQSCGGLAHGKVDVVRRPTGICSNKGLGDSARRVVVVLERKSGRLTDQKIKLSSSLGEDLPNV